MDPHLTKMLATLQKQFNANLSEWEKFIDFFHLQHLAEGEHWIKVGDLCEEFFYISEGIVRIYYVDHDGNEINEGFYDEGKLLGPISSFVNGSPCQYFMQSLFISNAKRDAKRLLSNGEQRYRWFCKEYPHFLERIPQYHIASFLSMTPVSLSRLRKKFNQATPSAST